MFAIFRPAPAANRDALAHDIAEQSVEELLRQIGANTVTMDAAELHGYLRARALPIVRALVERATGDLLPAAQLRALTTRAVEQAAHLAARELEAPPTVAIPAPHVPRRNAA